MFVNSKHQELHKVHNHLQIVYLRFNRDDKKKYGKN